MGPHQWSIDRIQTVDLRVEAAHGESVTELAVPKPQVIVPEYSLPTYLGKVPYGLLTFLPKVGKVVYLN